MADQTRVGARAERADEDVSSADTAPVNGVPDDSSAVDDDDVEFGAIGFDGDRADGDDPDVDVETELDLDDAASVATPHADPDSEAPPDRTARPAPDGARPTAADHEIGYGTVAAPSEPTAEPVAHETRPSPVVESLRRTLRPRGQLRARKVHRIVRRVDPWSVLKVSLVFYFCAWIMLIVAGVLMWGVAVGSGMVSSLETFIAEFLAFEEFHFNGDQLFQVFALGGLIGVFVATAVTAVLAVLFNLIADLTGGVRFTVIEEESARRILARSERS